MQPLECLIYASQASKPLSLLEFAAIVDASRLSNFQEKITGMLLYCEGQFMQCIEGPRDSVSRLQDKLARSGKHHSMVELTRNPVAVRQYADWFWAFNAGEGKHFSSNTIEAFLEGAQAFDTERVLPMEHEVMLEFWWRIRTGADHGASGHQPLPARGNGVSAHPLPH